MTKKNQKNLSVGGFQIYKPKIVLVSNALLDPRTQNVSNLNAIAILHDYV